MKAWGGSITGIGQQLSLVGAGIVTPLIGSALAFAKVGSDLNDMSKRTGIAVEELSTLKYAADQSGTSMEGLEVGVKKMQKAIVEAGDGSKSAQEALAGVGLTAARLAGLTPDAQFKLIAAGLEAIQDPGQRAAAAMAIFGKSGTELLPMIEGLSAAQAEARRLGLQMSTEDAKAADEFGDAIDRLKMQVGMLVVKVGGALAPVLSSFVRIAGGAASAASKWATENGGAITTVLKLGAAAVIAGGALIVLGKITGVASIGFLALKAVVWLTSAAVGAFWAIVAAGPIAIAAVAVGIVALVAAVGSLGGLFTTLQADLGGAFQGIKDAIRAGDIELAFRILGVSLELVWARMIERLLNRWVDFKEQIKLMATDMLPGSVAALARAGIKEDAQKQRDANAVSATERLAHLNELLKQAGQAAATADLTPLPGREAGMARAAKYGAEATASAIGPSTGTFNGAFAGQILSTNKTQDQIAQATKETAAELKKANKHLAKQGLAT